MSYRAVTALAIGCLSTTSMGTAYARSHRYTSTTVVETQVVSTTEVVQTQQGDPYQMSPGQQYSSVPTCYDTQHQELDVNNAQVVDWEVTTQNQFHARGHIQGQIVRLYADQTNHNHFSVQIGDASQTIEVIYSEDFGSLPVLQVGDNVEACGDYITSNAPSGPYPASPDGAIIHWVHASDTTRHESGYVAVNGAAYGDAVGGGSGD